MKTHKLFKLVSSFVLCAFAFTACEKKELGTTTVPSKKEETKKETKPTPKQTPAPKKSSSY